MIEGSCSVYRLFKLFRPGHSFQQQLFDLNSGESINKNKANYCESFNALITFRYALSSVPISVSFSKLPVSTTSFL